MSIRQRATVPRVEEAPKLAHGGRSQLSKVIGYSLTSLDSQAQAFASYRHTLIGPLGYTQYSL